MSPDPNDAPAADARRQALTVLRSCFEVSNWLELYPILREPFGVIRAQGLAVLDEMRELAYSETFASQAPAAQLAAHRNNIQTIRNIVDAAIDRGLARTFARIDLEISKSAGSGLLDLYDRIPAEQDHAERVRLLREVLSQAGERTAALQAQLHFELGAALAEKGIADADEEAIGHLQLALSAYTGDSDPRDWGVSHHTLAEICSRRTTGERAENIDLAIQHYHQSLQFFRQVTPSTMYARVVMKLASCYAERINGDRKENLARAIQACEVAAKLLTRDQDPPTWASAHAQLCEYFVTTGQGANQADEIAAHADAAADVFTQAEHPARWGKVQYFAGRACLLRFYHGNRDSTVLERGIERLTAALRVITREHDEDLWIDTQMLLGEAWKDRTVGDLVDNVERSIAAFERALGATPETSPRFALLQNGLGVSFTRRITGEQAKNRARARAHYERALQAIDRESSPYVWATIHMNLATIFWNDPSWGENEDQAISHSELALEVLTKAEYPLEWAALHTNLANFNLHRSSGPRADNVARAIEHATAALEVRTREAFPSGWAQDQALLGDALLTAASIDNDDGQRNEGVEHLEAALEIYRPETFPDECHRVARALGDLAFDRESWNAAAAAYETANNASRVLYKSALFRRTRRLQIGYAVLYHARAYALARLGRTRDAVVVLENSRGHELRNVLADPEELRLGNASDPEAMSLYREAQQIDRIADATDRSVGLPRVLHLSQAEAAAFAAGLDERAIKTMPNTFVVIDGRTDEQTHTEIFTSIRRKFEDEVRTMREAAARKREAAVERLRATAGLEHFAADPTFEDVAEAATPDCPIVFLVATRKGSMAAIVRRDASNEVDVDTVWLDTFSITNSLDLVIEWQRAQDQPADLEALLDRVLSQVREGLMAPVVAHLKSLGIRRATILPAGYLSLLPLHAAATGEKGGVAFGYAPSAHAVRVARDQQRMRASGTPSLFAVGNPRPGDMPLPFAHQEVASIARLFDPARVTTRFEDEASMGSVVGGTLEATHIHLACHCIVDWRDPLYSRLELADVPLHMRDIFYEYARAWANVSVVTVSACQSGAADLSAPDEAIGWPTAFLLAGVPTVIAAQWPVDDASTALLMSRLYEVMFGEDDADAIAALDRAQRWMQTVTVREIRERVTQGILDAEIAANIAARQIHPDPDWRPFADSPFDWAAFAAYGV